MGSKMLTGSLMFFGPILGIIMVFVEPGGMDEANFAVAAQNAIDNSLRMSIASMGFIVAMLAITIGTAYLARSMQGEQKLGSDLAGLASVLAFLSAAVACVSVGFEIVILDTGWADKGGDVTNAYASGEAVSRSIFLFMGAAILLLGIAIIRQKNLNQIVGGIAALFGAFMVGGGFLSEIVDIGGLIWFIGFLGWILITIVIGGITIKQTR